MPLLRLKKINNLVIGIDAKGNINKYDKLIEDAISKKVWRNQNLRKLTN